MIIINRKVHADAIVHAWPGAIVSCRWDRDAGEMSITFEPDSPIPEKTVAELNVAQDTYEVYLPWRNEIAETDQTMTRQMEDYLDEQGVTLKPGRTKDAYDAKKEVRARQP